MINFESRLAELRRGKCLTQKELGEILRVGERTVRYYEGGGRKPDFDGLVAMADFFGVSLDYLVGRTDDSKLHQLGD